MKKFTTEEIWKVWEESPEQIYREVVTGRIWTRPMYDEIDEFTKASLSRKAFRYVAEQSTKGTIPATLTAIILGFHKMKFGEPLPIGTSGDFPWMGEMTFTDKHGILIHVDLSCSWQITFRSIYGTKTVERPSGTHFDYIHTCIDIPQMYNDERYGWEINSEN